MKCAATQFICLFVNAPAVSVHKTCTPQFIDIFLYSPVISHTDKPDSDLITITHFYRRLIQQLPATLTTNDTYMTVHVRNYNYTYCIIICRCTNQWLPDVTTIAA